MDQLSAHLDRGWDLAQRGDSQGAHLSARRAIELSPGAPEPYNLLGYVAALSGDWEEAIEAYQHAALLDDTYVEAMLGAAELLIHPLGDHGEALALCRQVLAISDFPDEIIDAKLLQFEALLASGETDDAEKVLNSLPAGTYDQAIHNFLAGRAHCELENYGRAAELIDTAIEADPDNPEAHYQRGLIYDQQGERRASCERFMRVRQLELEAGLPPWTPDTDTILSAVHGALQGLSLAQQALLADSELYIVDMPGPEAIVDGVDVYTPILVDAGLKTTLDGTSTDGPVEPAVTETRIFVYLINMLRATRALSELQQTIQDALCIELELLQRELSEADK